MNYWTNLLDAKKFCWINLVALVFAGVATDNSMAQGLSPQTAVVTDLEGNPTGISTPGQQFLFRVPLLNITSSTQTNVIGVAVPMSDGLNVVNPSSSYGTITSLATADGTAYRGSLGTSVTVLRRYEAKIGVKSDQEQFDAVVQLAGNTGFGNGSQIAAWPPSGYGNDTGTISAAATANATELFVNATTGLLGGTIYRNQRTGELIAVNTVDPIQKKLLVRRGQYGGTIPVAVEAGDVLAYEGVPIPDKVSAGVALKVPVTKVAGTIGTFKVHIDSIVHPRVGDLTISLEAEDGVGSNRVTTTALLMAPLQGGLANGANITDVSFSDDGTTSADSQIGTLPSGGTYTPVDPLDEMAEADGSEISAWILRISDISSPVVGYIKGGWSMEPLD